MTKFRFLPLVLLCAAVCPAQLMRLTVGHVKPDRIDEFHELMKQTTAAYQKAGIAYRAVFTPAALGDQTTVYSFSPIDKFGDLDASILSKAMGERNYQTYLHRIRQCISDGRYEVVERRAELSLDEGPRPSGLYAVTTLQVKLGHEDAYEAKMKELIPALRKAGFKTFLVSRVVFGGPLGVYRIGRPIENLAELDKGTAMTRAFGKEGSERFRQSLMEHITSASYEVVRYDPELSFRK